MTELHAWRCDSCGARAEVLFPDSWRVAENPNVPGSLRHICDRCIKRLGDGAEGTREKESA